LSYDEVERERERERERGRERGNKIERGVTEEKNRKK
jgi:hypothetical protein